MPFQPVGPHRPQSPGTGPHEGMHRRQHGGGYALLGVGLHPQWGFGVTTREMSGRVVQYLL